MTVIQAGRQANSCTPLVPRRVWVSHWTAMMSFEWWFCHVVFSDVYMYMLYVGIYIYILWHVSNMRWMHGEYDSMEMVLRDPQIKLTIFLLLLLKIYRTITGAIITWMGKVFSLVHLAAIFSIFIVKGNWRLVKNSTMRIKSVRGCEPCYAGHDLFGWIGHWFKMK